MDLELNKDYLYKFVNALNRKCCKSNKLFKFSYLSWFESEIWKNKKKEMVNLNGKLKKKKGSFHLDNLIDLNV